MKSKKYLTHEQFAIHRKTLRDTARTDSWLTKNGLNAEAVSTVCSEVLVAKKKLHELLKQHAKLLTAEQQKLVKNFENRLNNTKKCKKLKPSFAYPILNLCTKIYRQAHRNELIARQKIQALRNKQQ